MGSASGHFVVATVCDHEMGKELFGSGHLPYVAKELGRVYFRKPVPFFLVSLYKCVEMLYALQYAIFGPGFNLHFRRNLSLGREHTNDT